MTHYELIEYAKSMGLHVATLSYMDPAHRTRVVELVFHLPDEYTPQGRYQRETIARLKYDDLMTQGDYMDACGLVYNTLKQFEYWR